MPCVADHVPVIDWARLQERWDHLIGLSLRCSGGQIDILLGLDYASMETRCGGDFEPVSAKTWLGWLFRGVVGANAKPKTAGESREGLSGYGWTCPHRRRPTANQNLPSGIF